jgi:hypothetical protein
MEKLAAITARVSEVAALVVLIVSAVMFVANGELSQGAFQLVVLVLLGHISTTMAQRDDN